MNILLLFDRIKNKILKMYREKVFYLKTGQKVSLVKNIILINTNLKIGQNVTIYPDVMLFGDGLIEIGDNVDIGDGTFIYASKPEYCQHRTAAASQGLPRTSTPAGMCSFIPFCRNPAIPEIPLQKYKTMVSYKK